MTGSSAMSVADSHITRASLRTLDKERIRQKALQMKMKEKLRMSMCVRIQKLAKKSPQVAQNLSINILAHLQQNALSTQVSDDQLVALVRQWSHQASQTDGEKPSSKHGATGIDDSHQTEKPRSRKVSKTTPHASSRSAKSESQGGDSPYTTEAQLQQRSVGFVLPQKKSPKKHKQGDIWNDLVQYQGLVEAQEAQIKRVEREAKKSQWSSELEAQIAAKQLRQHERSVEDEKYFEESMKNLQRLNEIEEEKERRRIERAKEQNVIQEEQRQFKLKKKQEELNARREAEARMAETIARQKKEEEAKEIARKEAEMKKMAKVLLENSEQLNIKKQLKQADRELELKLAEDYIRMEERKEALRQKGLEDLSMRIQAKMKFFDDTSKAEMDMKNKEDELRVLRYQADYEKKQMELEAKKKHDAAERNQAQQEYLKAQIKLKKDRESHEKEEYNKQADMWRNEREANEKKERLLQQQRAHKNQMQQNWLKQQIEAKEQQLLKADHTNLEVQINQSLLQKVNEMKHSDAVSTVAGKTRQRSRELHDVEKRTDSRKLKDPRLKPTTRK
ncbi:hypothetical protein H310_00005 [Aphanomyces invadans]|uniref:Trichohyalin-plectin-homology domain-containing protein n=1 Tax=Aphanomyces invadans TaxID=157072 RepID=A0A024UU19_9STRA|nr:hypothetical protein H310_00005 [Aphanomyces invadans]ETW09392.1 hypothetical protein H310_00005 [Aphanomyces invadans]|eukprot:XP_008860803.1 hypothetical protein H310_00005 [Aphanomyces invadans]